MNHRYKSGEPIFPGDVVSMCEGNLIQIGIVCFRVGEARDGEICYTHGYDGICVRVTHEIDGQIVHELTPPRIERNILPEKLQLQSHGPEQAYYMTGEAIRQGDIVALESEGSEIALMNLYKSHELLCDGKETPCLFLHTSSMGDFFYSYLREDGLIDLDVMQQIHFLARGRIPS